MRFKAVIFDMDGTLLDTLADIGHSVNRVLERHGFPVHPLDNYRYFIGDGSKLLIGRALPEKARQPEIIHACLQDYLVDYGEHMDHSARLFPGIPEVLDELTGKGMHLAVLTNKRHHLARACAGKFLVPWTFNPVLGFRDNVPAKPDPAGAIEIAGHLSILPAACIFVGDSDVDMATAKAAGMHGAGALWGYRTGEELNDAGASTLLKHPKDLLDLLE
jgi:phosphoglycolate phosphatase